MKNLTLIFASLTFITPMFHQPAVAEEKQSTDVAMLKKLEHSRDVLNGLVMEDFDKVLKSAKALKDCLDSCDWRTGLEMYFSSLKLDSLVQNVIFTKKKLKINKH